MLKDQVSHVPFFKETIKIFETNMKPRIWLIITGKTWRSESNHTIFYLHRTIIQRLYLYLQSYWPIYRYNCVCVYVCVDKYNCMYLYLRICTYIPTQTHTHIISQKGKLYKRDLQSYAFLVYFKICFLRWRKEFKHYIHMYIHIINMY